MSDRREGSNGFSAFLWFVIGLILGFILAKLISSERKPSSVVFSRDEQGNIVSITYV
jgi:hypothetical protein